MKFLSWLICCLFLMTGAKASDTAKPFVIPELKEWRGDRYAILEMRKFYSGYFKGLNNFKPYRIRLVTTNSYEEIEEILSLVEKDFDYEF